MKLEANVKINEDLMVPFSVLFFLLSLLQTLKRVREQTRLETFNEVNLNPRVDAEPPSNTAFKIALIKAARSLPGFDFDLRDGKNIVEFLFANLYTIEKVAEAIW